MTTTAKAEHYIVHEVAPGTFEVGKVTRDENGEWAEETRHKVTATSCDCTGFKFRHDCKHVHYVKEDRLQTRSVELDEARKIVRSVVEHLERDFPWVGLEDDEPYQRDPDGKINAVRMLLKWPTGTHPIRMFVLADGLLIRLRLVQRLD